MHFVICVFISLLCLVTTVLFNNVFAKWLKLALTALGSFTTGYAISILIRKIALLTKAFEKPSPQNLLKNKKVSAFFSSSLTKSLSFIP